MPLNNTEMLHLMTHLVRHEKVMQLAMDVLKASDFADELEKPYALIWAISQDWFKQSGKLISKDLMQAEIEKRLSSAGSSYMPPIMQAELYNLVNSIYSVDTASLVPDIAIKNWLQTFLNDRRLLPKLRAPILRNESIDSIVDQVMTTYNSTRLTSAEGCNVFDLGSPDAKVVSAPRLNTGCEVIDVITGGGLRDRELIGLLGYTSGGKTILAVQLAVSIAKSSRYVQYYSYEQPIIPEVRDRMWSCASGVSRKYIEGIAFDSMLPDIQAKIKDASTNLSKYLRCFDMQSQNTGCGGISEVKAIIQREVAAGRPPGCIIIDWISLMARRYMAMHNVDDGQIRGIILRLCNEFKTIAVTYNCPVILVQQLAGANGEKATLSSRPNHYNALDCKTFATQMDFCFVIGKKDEKNGGCNIRSTKARSVGNAECFAKLDGEFNRFVLTEGENICGRDGNQQFVERKDIDGNGVNSEVAEKDDEEVVDEYK